ncbi:MAG: hypothetical protein M1831_003439 [Alyxoria varia]|nr:MAG: hypothetical protein M1831_003439 [Alyxoria varia]
MPEYLSIRARLVVCDLKASLTEQPVQTQSGEFNTKVDTARNALLGGEYLAEEHLHFFDDHWKVKFIGSDQMHPFRTKHPFMMVRAGYRDIEKDNKQTQGYLFPIAAPPMTPAGGGKLGVPGPAYPSTPNRPIMPHTAQSTSDTDYDPITPNPSQRKGSTMISLHRGRRAGGSSIQADISPAGPSGSQQSSHPTRSGKGPPKMGYFPVAPSAQPADPKGKGKAKATEVPEEPVSYKGKGKAPAPPATPKKLTLKMGSTSAAGPSFEPPKSQTKNEHPEKALALVLEVKKEDLTKPPFSYKQDLMIDVFYNGVHAGTKVHARHLATNEYFVFSGTKISHLIEKAWTFNPGQEEIISSVEKTPREIAIQRFRAIAESLKEEARSYGGKNDGEVPPLADYLFSLAAIPLPEKIADLQQLGQPRFGVVDIVLTLGNADKLPQSAPYLQRAQKHPDPLYHTLTLLPFSESGKSDNPPAKGKGKSKQPKTAGGEREPQELEEETQGSSEQQPTYGSHEQQQPEPSQLLPSHGSFRATYSDTDMTMEDLEREIQTRADRMEAFGFDSTLVDLRNDYWPSDPIERSRANVQRSIEPVDPLNRLAREPSVEVGPNWTNMFGTRRIELPGEESDRTLTDFARNFTSTVAGSPATAKSKKRKGKHRRQRSSPELTTPGPGSRQSATPGVTSQQSLPKRRRGATVIGPRELRSLTDTPGSHLSASPGPRSTRNSSGRASPAVFGGPSSMARETPPSHPFGTRAGARSDARPTTSSYASGDPGHSHPATYARPPPGPSNTGYGASSYGQAGPSSPSGHAAQSNLGFAASTHGHQGPSYPPYSSQAPSYTAHSSSFAPAGSSNVFGSASLTKTLGSTYPPTGHGTSFAPSIGHGGSIDPTLTNTQQAIASSSRVDPGPSHAHEPIQWSSRPAAPTVGIAAPSSQTRNEPVTAAPANQTGKPRPLRINTLAPWTPPDLSRGSILSYHGAPHTPIDPASPNSKKRGPGRPPGSKNTKPPANLTDEEAVRKWRERERLRREGERREMEREEKRQFKEMGVGVRQVGGSKGGMFRQRGVLVGMRFLVGSDGLCGFGEEGVEGE